MDTSFQMAQWAAFAEGQLKVDEGPQAFQMVESDATGQTLLLRDGFGMDMIRFPAGGSVPLHTHPGDHILLVLSGTGFVDLMGHAVPLSPGMAYLVEGGRPHGIRAETSLVLLSIANAHRGVDSSDRLEVIR